MRGARGVTGTIRVGSVTKDALEIEIERKAVYVRGCSQVGQTNE